jgi:tetratricopeptide (TPR) repeat protein
MVSDEDKHAYKECSSPILQNNILLKLRLLSDGGYYMQANELLNKFSLTNFASLEQKEEFLYRSARIHHLSGNIPRAIEFYGKIVNITQVQNAYYPAMSSLQLGVIYEQLAQPQLAVSYYQKVLGFKNYDYRNSVSQKAKAGLSRLKQ